MSIVNSILNYINQSNTWQFWAVIVGFFVSLFELIRYRQGILPKAVNYRVISDRPIEVRPGSFGLSFYNPDGDLLQNPSLVYLCVQCVGISTIDKGNFRSGPSFSFNGRQVLDCVITETTPSSLKNTLEQKYPPQSQGDRVFFEDIELNPRDRVILQVIVSGYQSSGKRKAVQGSGTIHGGRFKEYSLVHRNIVLGISLFFLTVLAGRLFWVPSVSSSLPSGLICVDGKLIINGSSALYQLVQPVAENYTHYCGGSIIEVVPSSTSSQGQEALSEKSAQIADSDVPASPTYKFFDHQIAVFIFVIIINQQSGLDAVKTLSSEQLRGLFTGKYTQWGQLGGPPNLPITIVGRISTSGTRQVFQQKVLKGAVNLPVTLQNDCRTVADQQGYNRGIRYCEVGSAPEVVQKVGLINGAIGYVDLGSINGGGTSNMKVLSIDGNQPLQKLVMQNIYTFWSIEHMYTIDNPDRSSLEGAFLDYMLNGDFVSKVEIEHQYIPISYFNKERTS